MCFGNSRAGGDTALLPFFVQRWIQMWLSLFGQGSGAFFTCLEPGVFVLHSLDNVLVAGEISSHHCCWVHALNVSYS